MTDAQQRSQIKLLNKLNHHYQEQHPHETELAARIESFEMAYRMQMAAPEALDLNREPESIRNLYGLDNKKSAHFGKQCLMARRLVERGVRFVQIYSGGMDNQASWDGHIDIAGNHRGFAEETDQPIAALLTDLRQRGLADSTLVLCCGEFGRLPIAQKSDKPGRDHNPHAFTAWLFGGGVKGGVHYGETDDIGFKAAVDKVSVNDLHATVLHLLGINHEKLTYRYNGRDFRLTDVAGEVVNRILA
jgi:arylsulfatase A-like enzyme